MQKILEVDEKLNVYLSERKAAFSKWREDYHCWQQAPQDDAYRTIFVLCPSAHSEDVEKNIVSNEEDTAF